MRAYHILSDLYGDVRGWGRGRIRRDVAAAARLAPADLAARAARLFERRVRDALARFPLYAETVCAARGALPGAADPIRPEELPVWTRGDQRRLFAQLTGPPVPGAFVHATGGSTGAPTRFYVTRESFEWRAAVSDRGYAWAGAEEGRRSFYVWGTPIRPPSPARRVKTGLHHWLQRRTYFDSFQFDEAQKRRCCARIDRLKPPVIVGYAGNLIELARFVRDTPGVLRWRATALVTAAEGLLPGRRELIEEFLGGKIFMSYGSREFMLIGMECREHRGYHIAADNLLVEVVDDEGRPAAAGRPGRILITDLHNDANPFVRYEIGDLGSLAPADHRCPCGRPFPVLATVEGRIQEVILTPAGQRVTALFIPHLMKEFPWVEGYQLVQNERDALLVNLILDGDLSPSRTAPIEQQLHARLGPDILIAFAQVDRLQKNQSGKTPIVVANP